MITVQRRAKWSLTPACHFEENISIYINLEELFSHLHFILLSSLLFYFIALQSVTYNIQGQNKYSFLEPHHHAVLNSSKAINVQVCLDSCHRGHGSQLAECWPVLTCTVVSQVGMCSSSLLFLILGSFFCLHSPTFVSLLVLGILS